MIQGLGRQIKFSNQLFFAIILPPIIFSAGYNVHNSKFFDHVKLIGILGIAGALVSFVILAWCINLVNQYLFHALTIKQVLLLSSILCATDTVASMTLIRKNRFPVLNSILFGQGIINDAVAIILFHIITQLQLNQQNPFTTWSALTLTFNFIYQFLLSVAFGSITGFGLSYLFLKFYQSFSKKPIKQVSLILLNGYFTYLLGQLLGLSSIIGLFTCAIIMGNYCYNNISKQSKSGTKLAFQTVSYVAQAFIFAYLGASILGIQGKLQAIIMGLILLAFLPIVRAITVYAMPLIYKIMGRQFPLTDKQIKMCWFGGIIRGAIAFALCLQIQVQNDSQTDSQTGSQTGSQDKKYVTTIVLVIVMITTILSSTLLKKFKKYIGLMVSDQQVSQTQEYQLPKLISNYSNEDKNGNSQIMSKNLSQKNGNNKNMNLNLRFNNQYQNQHEQHESSRPLNLKLQQFQQKFGKPLFKIIHSNQRQSSKMIQEGDQYQNKQKQREKTNFKEKVSKYGDIQND